MPIILHHLSHYFYSEFRRKYLYLLRSLISTESSLYCILTLYIYFHRHKPLWMIFIRVKDFCCLRRCNAVRFCIWIGTVHSFYIAKYILAEREFMPSFSVWVAWHLIHSDRKKWLQKICSLFGWMLTAGSDVFYFWPCEMLSCLCNALYITYTNCYAGSAACTRIYFWKQIFRSVSQVPFFFCYSMTWEMHDAFSSVLDMVQRSRNTDLFHVSASCHIVLRKISSSNQII